MSRATALRAAQEGRPRLIETVPSGNQPPVSRRSGFWRATWRALPLVVAFVSTALLAYVLIFTDQPNPFSQLQRQEPEKTTPQDAPREQVASPQPEGTEQQQSSPDASEDLGPRLPMPRDDKLLTMIMSSLIALNQANATGNYTVLWEMSAPAFQRVNSAARLTEIFDKLRGRNLDLSPILLYQPKLFRRPEMNEEGAIRISGFFPTAPERVNFELMFQPVRGEWRLFGIAVHTSPAPPPSKSESAGEAATSKGAPPESSAAPKETKAEPPKPPAPPVKKPTPKPETAQTKEAPAPEAATPEIDVRDRVEAPRTPEKPKPKPKPKSDWNPFGR